MTDSIELIVRGLARNGSRILFCRSERGGYLYLPGGHVEFGESASRALRREFMEESGVDAAVGPLAMVCEVVFHQDSRTRHEVNLVFHVELAHPTVASIEPGISFDWLDLAAVPGADVRPEAIKAWLISGGGGGVEWVSQTPAEER